jgi:predicted amidohydrolase YtcJ
MNSKTKIFYNGKIFTSNSITPYASAMVVSDGIITWVGKDDEIPNIEGERIDMKRRRVLPGFIDGHVHPLMLAEATVQIPCAPPLVNSIEDILEQIRLRRKEQENDKWIEGWGYDEGKLKEGRAPNRWDLDMACPDVPVVIVRSCYHIVSVNSKALELAGIDKNTPDPQGGQIDRDSNGEPTGILRENARHLILYILPKRSKTDNLKLLTNLSKKLLSYGITTIADAYSRLEPDYYDLYNEASHSGMKQRILLYYDWHELKNQKVFDESKTNSKDKVWVRGIKIIGDGSISGKTAWVKPGYFRDEQNLGLPTTSKEELLEAYEYAKKHGLQLSVHAMGEQTIDLIVNTFYDINGWLKDAPSIRIEHAAMPTENALLKAARSHMAFVTQPIFSYAEIESYIRNLGDERTKKTYPFKKILDSSIKMSFSSDAPATAWTDPANPFVGIKSAVTRTAYDGTDIGRDQKIDVERAILLYTREAQQILGIPKVGQLTPGYRADFAVIKDDILNIPESMIDNVKVEETYIDGELVYEA